jgi:hypothetical protein
MYNDGVIGNLGILQVLGSHAAGHFNSLLPKGGSPYKLQDIIPNQYDYLYPPLTEEAKREQISKNLISFAMMQPGAPDVLKGQ